MKWFYDLKLKNKLLLSFSFVTLITVIIGLIGIMNIGNIAKSDKELYYNMTEPITYLTEISTYFQRVRVNTRDIVLANNINEIDSLANRINNHRKEIDKYSELFEKRILSNEVREAFQHFKNTRKEFSGHLNQLIQLAKNNQDEAAFEYLKKGVMYTASQNEQDAILKLADMKKNDALKRYESNADLASSTLMHVTILLILGVIAAAFLSISVARLVSKGVEQIKNRIESLRNMCIANLRKGAEQMAHGNLNVKIETGTSLLDVKSTDEIGSLSKDVNDIIQMIQSTVKSVESAVESLKEMMTDAQHLVNSTMEGNLKERGNSDKYEGVYRDLVGSLNKTLDAISLPFSEANSILEEMAGGNLTVKMNGEYSGDYKILKDSINTVAGSLNNALYEVTQAIQATSSASNQISASSEEMAAGAQEQSTQTTEVASAIEEMTQTIFETNRNTTTAANSSKRAGEIAADGGKIINETVEGMNRIAEVVSNAAVTVEKLGKSSDQIGEIVQVIDDIADQTNLLALNAAIEAARAGEQGRGFAVVADEVRKLAERTTKATKEIADMIKKIQKDTYGAVESIKKGTMEAEKGKELAKKSGESLSEIINSTNIVIDIVNQVAAASEQQSGAAEQISKSVEGISSVTQQSAAGVQQIARASEDLNRMTVNLQELISKFKISVDHERIKERNRIQYKSEQDLVHRLNLKNNGNGKLVNR